MQQAPLPAPVIPAGWTGKWTPPSEYGTLISPAVVVTVAANVAQLPQIATTLGQTIGTAFFFYGTYGLDGKTGGYLGNSFEQGNRYGAPATGSMIYFSDVEAANNWYPIMGAPFIASPPPVAGASGVAQLMQLIAQAQTTLSQIASLAQQV